MSAYWKCYAAVVASVLLANPAVAGIANDLKSCTAAEGLEAVTACTRVLESGRLPRNQRYIAHFNRGWAYRHGGEYTKALADLNRSIKLNRKYADSYYTRAVIYFDRGDGEAAMRDLDVYLKLKGKTWNAYYSRALLLRRLGRWEQALDEVGRAEAMRPNEDKIQLLKGLILSDQGKHDDGRAAVEGTMSSGPERADAFYARAVIGYRQNLLDAAQADAEKAIKLKKTFLAAYTLLGRIAQQRANPTPPWQDRDSEIAMSADSVKPAAAPVREKAEVPIAKTTGSSLLPVKKTSESCLRFMPAANTTIRVACGP